MILRVKYPDDFRRVMLYMKWQAEDGIRHFRDDYPGGFDAPEDLWDELRPRVRYKKDPKGIELFQTYQTLMYANYWGIPGAGDCDCFTVTLLTACMANDLPYRIVLAGREPAAPVHIYIKVCGRVMDMTRSDFDSERPYPLRQEFTF